MSKNAIQGLKPELIWQRFYEITQVPRPSKKEGKILEYLRNFARENKIEFREDAVGNIVFSIPATKGYENSPVVVLQGHVDMVCEKNKGTEHDFDNDPLKLIRDNEWLKAEGTTLGSDNGIGVAAALAIATDENAIHGPIECLFTVDEETGLTGANNLQPGFITGKLLLNMDSEEDGAFYIGCSGGQDSQGVLNLEFENSAAGSTAYTLEISGLKGGHSGLDIDKGRGNAIKMLARALNTLKQVEYQLAKIEGGSKRNAIPREAEAVVLIKPADVKKAEDIIKQVEKDLKNEFGKNEPDLKVTLNKSNEEFKQTFSKSLQTKILQVLLGLPHGVIEMSMDMPGLVETSTNLATINKINGHLVIGTSQRSSIESAKRYIADSVRSVFTLAGADIKSGDGYPGWKPDLDSTILKKSVTVFKNLFGKEPELKAIHAGLECGILGDKYPGTEMISFGPTIQGAHSPDEKINIPTVEKFYNLLTAILKEIAQK